MKRKRNPSRRAQQVKWGLTLFYILTASFLVWGLHNHSFNTKQLIALIGLLFVVTEGASRMLLKRFQPTSGEAEPHAFRMEPHIFTHFLPSRTYADITPEGFRMTGHTHVRRMQAERTATLYLTGDCTFFEEHLPLNQTFAHILEKQLKGVRVLNAGTDHYTALHAYNRFVLDLVRGVKPDRVLFSCAANDSLSFIHHKQGRVQPDHTHMYRPWSDPFQRYQKISRIPTATLRLFFSYLFFRKRHPEWDEFAEAIAPTYHEPRSVETAQRLFDPTGFRTCLKLFRGTCQTIGAELVLTTFAYQHQDMGSSPRKSYAWGIDRMNETIREFAQTHRLRLIDWARDLHPNSEDITNKWHYTGSGNQKRARLALDPLRESRQPTGEILHELARTLK